MRSPIERMIDEACGVPKGERFSAPAPQVTLRCPKCKRTKMAPKDDTDYPDTVTVEIICPKCDDGDFHETVHLDARGKHITRDPDDDDPTPYCLHCGPKSACDCGPIARNE